MAAGRHFKFANFDTLSRDRFQNENLRQHTKSHFKKNIILFPHTKNCIKTASIGH